MKAFENPGLSKEDYTDPVCPFDTSAYEKEPPVRSIPVSRVIEKEDEFLSRNDPEGAERLFVAGPLRIAASGAVTGRIGSGEGDAYVVASLYGNARELLHTERFTVPAGSVKDLSFPYKETYPDAVRLQLFYFIHGKSVSYEREYRREKDRYTLPLSFTRFRDAAFPGARYTFSLTTAPGAEVLAAAWDKSLEKFNEGVHDFSEVDYNLRGSVERMDLAVRDLASALREINRRVGAGGTQK